MVLVRCVYLSVLMTLREMPCYHSGSEPKSDTDFYAGLVASSRSWVSGRSWDLASGFLSHPDWR